MEKKKMLILTCVITLIIIAVIILIIVLNNKPKNTDKENANNNNSNQATHNSMDLNIWNGVYQKEDIEVTLYRSGVDTIDIRITNKANSDGSLTSTSLTLTLDSTETLSIEDTFFDNTYSITIIKTETGITLKTTSSDEKSILNSSSGEYTKKEHTNYGWDGLYEYNNIKIILAEVSNTELIISISKGISIVSTYFDNITNNKLQYNDTFFDDTSSIIIIKTNNGIKVEASSSDEESLLNDIEGTYTKK